MNTTGCRVGCVLDCPYCHVHVIDVYSHLRYVPCLRAALAGQAWECCGTEPQPCPVHAGTGAHSSAESLMAGVESDGLRVKAAALAVQMQGWLSAPVGVVTPFDDWPCSDLVEWCRSARDVLEAVGRG